MPKSQSSIDSEETLFEELSNPTRPISNPPDVLPTSDTLLTGNILLTLNGPAGDRKLFFTRLLPKAEDLQETNWTVNLPFYGWSVAMHPPANVLAMSQNTGSTSAIPIHILRMDNGESHPLASLSPLKLNLSRANLSRAFHGIHGPNMSISQSTVAVLFHESKLESIVDKDRLVVWNWRTGSMVYSGTDTFYETITLVSDTWLVAGYRAGPNIDPQLPIFAIHLIDTSAEDTPKTCLQLQVPPFHEPNGHFFGLHSGESLLWDPSPESGPQLPSLPSSPGAILMAQIHTYDSETEKTTVCCVALRLCKLLELVKQGGIIPWEKWGHYAFVLQKVLTNRVFCDFSVSGCRLLGPLEEVEQDQLDIKIHEFDPRPGAHVSPSEEGSSLNTDLALLEDAEVKERKAEKGKDGEQLVSGLQSSELVTVGFDVKEKDLAGFRVNATIVEDHLVFAEWNSGEENWAVEPYPLPTNAPHAS